MAGASQCSAALSLMRGRGRRGSEAARRRSPGRALKQFGKFSRSSRSTAAGAQLSGLGTCMTDRYQDVRDTPPSVGGDHRDEAAVSSGSGRAGRVDGHRGSSRFGVSRQAVHRWWAWYQQEGLAGLADRSSRPRSSPTQTPAELEALICELRRTHRRWGARRVLFERGRTGYPGPLPSRITVQTGQAKDRLAAGEVWQTMG